jgi:hypothetical protein
MQHLSTAEEVEALFLAKMRTLYRSPYGTDEGAALAEYTEFLMRFHAGRMPAAFEWLIANHKRRDWPSVYDLTRAFDETRPAPAAQRISDDRQRAAQEWISGLSKDKREALHWQHGKFVSTEIEIHRGDKVEVQVERYYLPSDPTWMLKAYGIA